MGLYGGKLDGLENDERLCFYYNQHEDTDYTVLYLTQRRKGRKGDLITHVDIICHYSNQFDSTILYLHRLRLCFY